MTKLKTSRAVSSWVMCLAFLIGLVIVGLYLMSYKTQEGRVGDCHLRGGGYMESLGTSLCVKNGVIIKIYPKER